MLHSTQECDPPSGASCSRSGSIEVSASCHGVAAAVQAADSLQCRWMGKIVLCDALQVTELQTDNTARMLPWIIYGEQQAN